MNTNSKTNRILSIFILVICFQSYAQTFSPEQEEMLQLVNDLRATKGLKAVRLNANLNTAATKHSTDMAQNNYIDHTGLNGSTFGQRAKEAGYEGAPRGENIAAGNKSVADTFEQWKNSPGHLNNMINSSVNEMGIGYANERESIYRHYWTQIFGRGKEKTLSITPVTIAEKSPVTVYPNPIRDVVTLEFDTAIKKEQVFTITTMTGQVVRQQIAQRNLNKVQINLSSLPANVYVLHTDGNFSQKIVKL